MHTQLCISEILLFKIRSSLVLHFLFFSIKLFFQFIPFLNSPINELNLIKFVSIFREMKHHCQWSFAQIVSICNPKMEKNLGCKKRRKEKKNSIRKNVQIFWERYSRTRTHGFRIWSNSTCTRSFNAQSHYLGGDFFVQENSFFFAMKIYKENSEEKCEKFSLLGFLKMPDVVGFSANFAILSASSCSFGIWNF